MYPLEDTIAAKATGDGGAARGIVRISGPRLAECLRPVFLANSTSDWEAVRRATVIPGRVALAGNTWWLPCDLYYWPDERSYTRQRTAELHTMGSPPLLEMVLQAVCRHGARLAQPGEFTLRAFLAGRLDLPQAEAVLGIIDAQSPEELGTALAQLAGGLSDEFNLLRDSLLNLTADLEAGLDFVDQDITFVSAQQQQHQLELAFQRVVELQQKMRTRAVMDSEPRVVLCGLPNTGKSSLLNALAGQSAAIVTSETGTTRDYLQLPLDLNGVRCVLIDTAGIERTSNLGEHARRAQHMMQRQRERAQLELLCVDSSRSLLPDEEFELSRALAAPRITVLTKSDLPQRVQLPQALLTSSRTAQGLGDLRSAIREQLIDTAASSGEVVMLTAVRCQENLRQMAECLSASMALVQRAAGEELVVEEIRLALDALGQIVGTIYTEDLLDRIFSRFCLGK